MIDRMDRKYEITLSLGIDHQMVMGHLSFLSNSFEQFVKFDDVRAIEKTLIAFDMNLFCITDTCN